MSTPMVAQPPPVCQGQALTPIWALSLWQPWATLWASGHKNVETRSWDTSIRGFVAVHATRSLNAEGRDYCGRPFFAEAVRHLAGGPDGLPLGAIIGFTEIVDCLPVEMVRRAGDFREGAPGVTQATGDGTAEALSIPVGSGDAPASMLRRLPRPPLCVVCALVFFAACCILAAVWMFP